MTTMPKGQIHEQHDSMPGVSMVEYVIAAATRQGTTIPPHDKLEGNIHAELYRGLWIARCTSCSGAVAVTSLEPLSMCPDCGAGWFQVIFPKNKPEIETELMRRPQMRGGVMKFANWDPVGGKAASGEPNGKPESLAQLQGETEVLLATARGAT